MASYHVYFSAKDGVSEDELLGQVHRFMDIQLRENLAVSYQLLRYDNKATFPDLLDYHLIVEYLNKQDRSKAFELMKEFVNVDPHAPLMRMVSDFKVAFSVEEKA